MILFCAELPPSKFLFSVESAATVKVALPESEENVRDLHAELRLLVLYKLNVVFASLEASNVSDLRVGDKSRANILTLTVPAIMTSVVLATAGTPPVQLAALLQSAKAPVQVKVAAVA